MPRRSANVDANDPAPALTRGVRLLERLGRDGPQVLERIAGESGIAKSTALRLLNALERIGMVARDPATRRWHARVALVSGGDSEAERARLRQVLADLARAGRHAAEAWAWRDGRPTMVDRADPEDVSTVVRARIGADRDLVEVDAVVLVGFAGDPAGARWLRSHTQAQDRRQVPVAREALAAQVEMCRRAGCACDAGINANGVRRFAAPWRDAAGAFRGAIVLAVGGGLPAGPDDARLLELVRAAAARMGG
ncbi:MAG: helix-turn-helix domain-containing protein [Planctomycetes bacterium]|nr:helix-turn-helix domain-containing protein [Planctomycetota bacterium]